MRQPHIVRCTLWVEGQQYNREFTVDPSSPEKRTLLRLEMAKVVRQFSATLTNHDSHKLKEAE
jgi:hypothetical protein